jgi:dTDP-4-dehydrorhamnose 3,5-epimerase
MKIIETEISDVKIIELDAFPDDRGFFCETYQERRYISNGISEKFLQDNLSYSKKNVLRGLHFQKKNPQGKLIIAISGEIFDVAVDIRLKSSTYGKWVGVVLSNKNHQQLYVPPGFAHGFCVISDDAFVNYKCTNYFDPEDNHGLIWNDPDIGIDWPIQNPIVSPRDEQLPQFNDYMAESGIS